MGALGFPSTMPFCGMPANSAAVSFCPGTTSPAFSFGLPLPLPDAIAMTATTTAASASAPPITHSRWR